MKNLSTHDKTYSGIPLSVIYNQIIRFMKENGIYTPYLEISLPQTNMSYERFLINFRRFKNTTLDHFFLYKFNVGEKYNAFLENERKGLKKKRINKYNIKNDELTGDILRRKTAEFSHIRNYCIYREISSDIENGLIVNKETHVIITKKGINDENELKELCIEKGWNLEWYKKYKNYFNIR